MNDLVKRLGKFLAENGVTPEKYHALEREMGWSKDSVNRWLRGKQQSISIDRVATLIAAYPQLNTEWLFRGKGPMYTTEYKSLITKVKDLEKQVEQSTKQNELLKDHDFYIKERPHVWKSQ